jgi:hypothetical protein
MRARAAILAVLLAACSGGQGSVTGLVVEVEGDLEVVTSFTVNAGGIEYRFVPIPGVVYEFPLPHLREHLREAAPVTVDYRDNGGGVLEVLGLADP